MKSSKSISYPLLAGVMALAVCLPTLAQSENEAGRHRFAPQINGFSVDEVARLRPGVELNFALSGSPGGWATLHIEGAAHNLTLVEVEPGRYEGVYTISGRDKIAARSPVTANLRVGNQVSSEVLNESLQSGVGFHPNNRGNNNSSNSGPLVAITQVSVEPLNDLDAGNVLRFSVSASPGGRVDLSISGMRGKVLLYETASGQYSGSYTIRNRDRITANSVVIANLQLGQRNVSARLGQSLLSAEAPRNNDTSRICYNCGVVEAVNLVEVRGEGNYLGTIGGGVLGALLGSQVGNGNGRTAAEIAGAVGGAYAGNRIQGNAKRAQHYEVSVRLQAGGLQILSFDHDPGYHTGDKVRLNNGNLSRM